MENVDQKTILIIDDSPEVITILRDVLKADYRVLAATSGDQGIVVALRETPDLILLDLVMPDTSGFNVRKKLREHAATSEIPVIFVTSRNSPEDEALGFEMGCVDYIAKPVVPETVRTRVANQIRLADQNLHFRELLAARQDELDETETAAIQMLSMAGHYKDESTASHMQRMAAYSAALAEGLGWPAGAVRLLEKAAPLHDVGKIGIPDEILLSENKLTDEQWIVMRSHTVIGESILARSEAPLFVMAAEVAVAHHERWDGTGYPHRLQGDEIPEAGRIVAIADTFDALTTVRPYKEAWSIDKAFDYLKENAGSHFDPAMVDIFFDIREKIESIKAHWDSLDDGGQLTVSWI